LIVRLFRPLARRRESTSRPFFVLIRERNPWTRDLRRFFGWYVRFGMSVRTQEYTDKYAKDCDIWQV